MNRFRLTCLLILSVTAGACSDDAPPPRSVSSAAGATAAATVDQANPAPSSPRIVFLGDSLTAGYGLQRDESVPALVAKELRSAGYRYDVVNAGVSGDTSAGGLTRLEWSLEGDVQILVIELGANDGLRGLPVAQMKKNLEAIITAAQQRRIKVLLTGMEAPPNYGPAYTAEFRAAFRDLANVHALPFVPFYLEGVAGNPRLNLADGIHPNPEGARIVARGIWRALEPLLDKQGR